MDVDYKKICEQVCEIAKETGTFIANERKTFSLDKVEHKGSQDLVSYVDKEAEKIVVSGLKNLIPGAGFITEEGTTEKATDEHYKWIIDPLDGTTNFIHGLPPYCVSIGLVAGDEIVVGVVYEITVGECFYAWQGSEAYLNGEVIRVSNIDTLTDSLIAVGLSHSAGDTIDRLLKNMDYFLRNTNGARRLGSAAADLVYVAAGRFEGFYQSKLSPWDVAAGALIVQRAGGCVTDFSGGDNYLFGREIIATNKLLYNDFKKVILD